MFYAVTAIAAIALVVSIYGAFVKKRQVVKTAQTTPSFCLMKMSAGMLLSVVSAQTLD